MARRRLIVGNWKLNAPDPAKFRDIVRGDIDVAICPPFTLLGAAAEALGGNVALGAQDCFWVDSGAYTGQVSASLLAQAGCRYCIVGHSERRGRFGTAVLEEQLRAYFSDSNPVVHHKLKAALGAGLTAILCVGETAIERDQGETEAIIEEQVETALADIGPTDAICIAYEPVWAIGTGSVCDENDANAICGWIRRLVARVWNDEFSERVRILYGGSVTPDNCSNLLSQPNIDGLLVGGASLDPSSFRSIVNSR